MRQPPLALGHGVGGLAGYHALYFAALALAPAVGANLITYAWPLRIVLLSALVLGLPLGPQRLAGLGFGVAGGAVPLAGGGGGEGGALGWLGYLAAFGCAIVWSVYSVTARPLAAVPTEAVAGFCAAAAVVPALLHLASEGSVVPDARQALAALLLGLGPVGAAFFLWDAGMKRGDPRVPGTLAYAVPVVSTLLLVAAGEGALDARVALAAALVAGDGLLAARA